MGMESCTKRIAVVCNELGIDYNLVEVNPMKGENQTSEYKMNHQPFGIIPAFEVRHRDNLSGSESMHIHMANERTRTEPGFTSRMRYVAAWRPSTAEIPDYFRRVQKISKRTVFLSKRPVLNIALLIHRLVGLSTSAYWLSEYDCGVELYGC